jgi:hypothetical protein
LRTPTHEGILLELDTLDWTVPQVLDVAANDLITVRLTETEIGWGWARPTYEWKCAEVINENLGQFTTGYHQWLIKAGNTSEDCQDIVPLTRSSGEEVTITVNVQKGFCEPKECSGEFIQNLAVTSCECEPFHPHLGMLIDLKDNVHDEFVFAI